MSRFGFNAFPGRLKIKEKYTMEVVTSNVQDINLKTCYRCGVEFDGCMDRVCPECRKPGARDRRGIEGALTFREMQVAKRVSEAKLNKEIAVELRLSEGTIKEYMNRIFRKLEVKNRTELAIWVARHVDSAA
jgi:DNA-binding NarL/FixJ family response regulator